MAISSKLGWLLSGPVSFSNNNEYVCNGNSVINTNLVLDILPSREEVVDESREIVESLDHFWKHESMGIANEEQTGKYAPLEIAFKENQRYEVGLPWKDNISDELGTNYDLSKRRLLSLYNKLKADPKLLSQYNEVFEQQFSDGIIEKVNETDYEDSNAHFLCHFGVVRNERQTTKLRIVFDGSARSSNSLSLNDRLESGVNHMPLLFNTIIRFMMHPVVLTADIEKAFLQVQIRKPDRNVLRLLWFDDIESESPSIIQYQYCRLVFGLTCSPSILGETIKLHVSQFESKYPQTVKHLRSLYCDDFLCGASTAQEALSIYNEAKQIMAAGGFNLRKWNSNDSNVSQEISKLESSEGLSSCDNVKVVEDDQTYSKYINGTVKADDQLKVLGVGWDNNKDTLQVELTGIAAFAKDLPKTKRSVLRIAAKIFDPVGYLTVFTIMFKVFFQQLCVQKCNWDDELDEQNRKTYDTLIKAIENLPQIDIPRYPFLAGEKVVRTELHGFSDASEIAFATSVYLRVEYESGNISTRLISSKSKVAPIKRQSIPRLELLGAGLMVKLVGTIYGVMQEELKGQIIEKYYWVDSMAVLCWVKNCKPWVQYVRNRVNEILQHSNRDQWFYCPGPINPADLPSRGRYRDIETNLLWWEGPEFLKLGSHEWPKSPCGEELETEIAMKEKAKSDPQITRSMLISSNKPTMNVDEIVEIDRFSQKDKLLRCIGWVLRFISNCKSAIRKSELNLEPNLNVSEVEGAETALIRSIQSESFANEINYLSRTESIRKTMKAPLYVKQFNLHLDENNIVRCRSRIGHYIVPDSGKRPILLPAKHRYTELIISDAHQKVFHNGIVDTLSLTRQRYWILRGREQVKRNLRKCIVCKKIEGLPFMTVYNPELPQIRVDEAPPFSHVGIDFAGPLMVTSKEQGEVMKTYICLFTCGSTRAIHLELVESLSVESFIRAFRRFCGRRGLPATIITDNAKTFKSAALEVKKLLRAPRLSEHFKWKGVRWIFIPELAPFQGGFWERMVRSVKRCLIKVVGRALVAYDELTTLLVEIENVINSRPLTYIADDSDGISYPLTPSQLVNGRNLSSSPDDAHFEVINTYQGLSKRAKYHRQLLSQFCNRWKNEYLLSLMEKYRPRDDSMFNPDIQVNDICILRDSQAKRVFWKLCKVEQLVTGRDGSVRSARVSVLSNNSKKLFLRSLKHLIPLEIRATSSPDEQTALAASPTVPQAPNTEAQTQTQAQNIDMPAPHQTLRRAKRNAAILGELARKYRY